MFGLSDIFWSIIHLQVEGSCLLMICDGQLGKQ